MLRRSVLVFLFLAALCVHSARAQVRQHLDVWVVAPSVSTSMEARTILQKLGWTEVPLRRAEAALVVVRSTLNNPLAASYRSTCDLTHDADMQLNIAGTNFSVYVYSLTDNMGAVQSDHTSYKAE